MSGLTGTTLEIKGKDLFDTMGLVCVAQLAHVRLRDIAPEGGHGTGDSLEFDYLIPLGRICLVGEITSRNAKQLSSKYTTHRRHIEVLRHALVQCANRSERDHLWTTLGVPSNVLPHFSRVRELRSFVMATEVERAEVDLPSVSNTHVFYRYSWKVLNEYANCIGTYANCSFLDAMKTSIPSVTTSDTDLKLSGAKGQLLPVLDRYVTSDQTHTSHVLTFVESPYTLLPYSRVWRRDALPVVDSSASERYQRMLVRRKLEEIRAGVLQNSEFLFPSSILAVLSADCEYDDDTNLLTIPKQYGALNIVDGQHRMFAYAEPKLQGRIKDTARILVTAIVFDNADEDYVNKVSARTFIEINTNQTRVSSKHLYGIAYESLGHDDHRSIAAHILRVVNERPKGSIRGLLNTSDSPTGRIKIMEIVGSLGVLTNKDKMATLAKSSPKKYVKRKIGIGELFKATPNELANAEILVNKGVVCIERYFNTVARVFIHDWPSVAGDSNGSAFELTKFMAAWVKLLGRFVNEGLTWREVKGQLEAIRDNVKSKRRVKRYTSVLFDTSQTVIPDATNRISDNLAFLDLNRSSPTSIRQAINSRR